MRESWGESIRRQFELAIQTLFLPVRPDKNGVVRIIGLRSE